MPELLLYNTETRVVHAPDCRWLRRAAGGKQPLNLSLYRLLSADDPLPTGARRVNCCSPSRRSPSQDSELSLHEGEEPMEVLTFKRGVIIETYERGDDGAYEACIKRFGGYVLTGRSGAFVLHDAGCAHIGPLQGGEHKIDGPRRWASRPEQLCAYAAAKTGNEPQRCRSCL
jgi:hypothetical protein